MRFPWRPIVLAALSVCLLFAGAGCGIFSFFDTAPYHPVSYFDIGAPKNLSPTGLKVQIQPFVSEGPYDPPMVFKSGPYSVQFDQYNRWSQFPNNMLRRYFELYLNDPSTEADFSAIPKYSLSATLVNFEGVLTPDGSEVGNQAVLSLNVSVQDYANGKLLWTKLFHEVAPMPSRSAQSFAQAMAEAVAKVAPKVKDKLLELERDATINQAQ